MFKSLCINAIFIAFLWLDHKLAIEKYCFRLIWYFTFDLKSEKLYFYPFYYCCYQIYTNVFLLLFMNSSICL